MKKFIFISLLTFLLSSGFTVQSQAQTVSHYFTSQYWIPLICNGVEIDNLLGDVTIHCRMHYQNGELVWMKHSYAGSFTSQLSGEVFEVQETDNIDLTLDTYTFHANIRGSQNNHYILSGSGLYVEPYTIFIDKAMCLSQ